MSRLRPLLFAVVAVVLGVAVVLAASRPTDLATAIPDSGIATASPAPSFAPTVAPSAAPSPPPQATRDAPPRRAPTGIVGRRTGLVAGTVDRTSLALEATYDVDLELRFDSRRIRVDSRMMVVNRSASGIDRLELNTVAARLGGLAVTAASVDGRPVATTIDDQTLVVPFGGVLQPGRSVPVRITFEATLRSGVSGHDWMFTRANGIAELYRWLPWVSARRAFDRPNIGDPWVTPVSPRVTVAITTDRPLVVVAPGDRIEVSGLTQVFRAENVRDFSIAASPDYKTASAVVGDTTIRAYYRPGGPGSTYLAQAKAAIQRMEALVGPYPYGTYRVVQSAGGYAIESPAVSWIPTGAPSANLAYLVHHETAHQWFYGIVGADQANEPFTDEAAADFVTRHVLGTRRASRCAAARLDLSIYRYSGACYYEVVYIQGGNFLNDLRTRMGNTAFWGGMRAWIEEQRFQIAPTKSLLETLDEHTPLDLVPRFEPRFPRLY